MRPGKHFFPKDSYLGVLRLFLRVLEVARSRRLGSVGEVSVWPNPVLHKISRCQFQKPVFFRSAQEFGRAFFLLEKRPLVDLPIRKVRAREFVRARRGRGFFSTQRLQICADWVLSTQSSPAACAFGGWQEFGWLRLGSGFRYTEIADCIYTEIADALVVAGL